MDFVNYLYLKVHDMNAVTDLRKSEQTEYVRAFNRFYTRHIGLLREGILASRFSLTEARVLWELADRGTAAAKDIAADTGLDPAYLSRILRRFRDAGFVSTEPSPDDGRQQLLTLTIAGNKAFAGLDAASAREVGAMLGALTPDQQRRLTGAMAAIRDILGPASERGDDRTEPWLIRSLEPGDMGWVIHRHAVLYTQEYQWNQEFEALVAEVGAAFIRNFDPQFERAWIAERDGKIVGSVFLVREDGTTARLRMLYVEPSTRGLGIGKRLVAECLRQARNMGYARMVLWTNDILTAARAIYEAEGFRLVRETPHHSFGADLVGQDWALDL